MGIVGIDISTFQTVTDWDALANAVSFIICKASEGSDTGRMFAKRANFYRMVRAECLKRKIPFGAYHYYHPSQDSTAQFDRFTLVLNSAQSPELPIALDYEETDQGIPNDMIILRASKMLSDIRSYSGRKPILYSYPDFLAHHNAASLQDSYLWYASYGADNPIELSPPNRPVPNTSPFGWFMPTIWQYAEFVTVPGIVGVHNCDANYFDGTIEELLAL